MQYLNPYKFKFHLTINTDVNAKKLALGISTYILSPLAKSNLQNMRDHCPLETISQVKFTINQSAEYGSDHQFGIIPMVQDLLYSPR